METVNLKKIKEDHIIDRRCKYCDASLNSPWGHSCNPYAKLIKITNVRGTK